MAKRPITTLFLMTSVDGKISTGASDQLDVDRDFSALDGVKEGLHQYYELEAQTDLWSLNTGRVMRKIGVNERTEAPEPMGVSFVIVDNRPHLDQNGVSYLCRWVRNLVLVTTNREHPAFSVQEENLRVIYQENLHLKRLLEQLAEEYNVERLTVQSGGTLNGLFLREKLLDYVNIVVAPVLIGGKDTSSLIDGSSITERSQLDRLGVLQLERCDVLAHSYLHLCYRVVHSNDKGGIPYAGVSGN